MVKEGIQTEADALQALFDWSKSRPRWQQDALRRLLANGELTETDLDELIQQCIEAPTAGRVAAEANLTTRHAGAPTVALKSVRDVQNVNALAERQTLTFIPKGVTVIYGDNGAGKSGYVRLLKRSCRARARKGKEEPLHPNIYKTADGPQRAQLEYHAGAQVQKASWQGGQATDALLSEISVFDSRTANVHVEETNDLAYTPYPMKLLENLVRACKSIKDSIDDDINTIKAKTPFSISEPACDPGTEVGQLLHKLSKDTKSDTVKSLATLSDEDIAQMAVLTSDLAQDPTKTAKLLRARKTRLGGMRDCLQKLQLSITPSAAQALTDLSSDFTAKQIAAKLASEDLFHDDPLNGIGSETWQTLWNAARAYSIAEAYPEDSFPATDGTAHCVLCQQNLETDAKLRLQRFEAFVQDRTQQDEATAQKDMSAYVQELHTNKVSFATFLADQKYLTDELDAPEMAHNHRVFVIKALWRLRGILKTKADGPFEVPSLDDIGFDAAISGLEKRATDLLAEGDNIARKEMQNELVELKDRKWLSGVKDDVLAQIARLEEIHTLNVALKDTRPTQITAKNTELSKALITERLRGRFAQEVDNLNLGRLAIELDQAGSKGGISRFRVSLIHKKSDNAGTILSEGEYRCVALAGFLAELATNDSDSGIILDDPVSSLDHLHREAIAKRLAEEGKKRQVIVFTHDLPFLFLLRNACIQGNDPSLKTELAVRHIQKRQNTPGYCRNEPPEKAQNANSRLSSLRSHLANTKIQYDRDPDSTDWLMTARGLVDSLRQAWETAIEDAISPVLRTFSSKVDTKGFAKISAITEAHAHTMRQHYGECSILLHKTSDAMNPVAPTPERIETELLALDTWLSDIELRQRKIHVA